jgi:16S rRNA processing protein RimM
MNDSRHVEVGRLGAAHGVRGWLRVQSYTEPPARLFEWRRWWLQSGSTPLREVKLLEARPQGDAWVVRLEGIDERDAASRLTGQRVLVEREELPAATGREHYRADLVGFEVRNVEGALLGQVDYFIDTPANAVMVVRGEREHLIPVVREHLRSVDRDARRLVVDWPEDF